MTLRLGLRMGAVSAVVLIALLVFSGCGKPQTMNELATETFGPWTSKVNGTTLSFTEPATVVFSMSNFWNDLSEEEQTTFMQDAGDTWQRVASGRADKESDIKVVFEDNMGNVIATYQAGKGLLRDAP